MTNDHLAGNDNLILWDRMRKVDRAHTKPIKGKSYSGDSPNPTYIMRKLTEALGPIGGTWGFTVMNETVYEGKPHQITVAQTITYDDVGEVVSKSIEHQLVFEKMHQVHVRFWFRPEPGQNSTYFDCFGGTQLLYMSKNGNWIHDEDAAKKSLTDAYVKGASWLGACADLFMGIFDDRYSGENVDVDSGPPQEISVPRDQHPPATSGARNTSTPDPEGWD